MRRGLAKWCCGRRIFFDFCPGLPEGPAERCLEEMNPHWCTLCLVGCSLRNRLNPRTVYNTRVPVFFA